LNTTVNDVNLYFDGITWNKYPGLFCTDSNTANDTNCFYSWNNPAEGVWYALGSASDYFNITRDASDASWTVDMSPPTVDYLMATEDTNDYITNNNIIFDVNDISSIISAINVWLDDNAITLSPNWVKSTTFSKTDDCVSYNESGKTFHCDYNESDLVFGKWNVMVEVVLPGTDANVKLISDPTGTSSWLWYDPLAPVSTMSPPIVFRNYWFDSNITTTDQGTGYEYRYFNIDGNGPVKLTNYFTTDPDLGRGDSQFNTRLLDGNLDALQVFLTMDRAKTGSYYYLTNGAGGDDSEQFNNFADAYAQEDCNTFDSNSGVGIGGDFNDAVSDDPLCQIHLTVPDAQTYFLEFDMYVDQNKGDYNDNGYIIANLYTGTFFGGGPITGLQRGSYISYDDNGSITFCNYSKVLSTTNRCISTAAGYITNDKWIHLGFESRPDGNARIYVDNVKVKDQNIVWYTGIHVASPTFGRQHDGISDNNFGNNLYAYFDNIMFWSANHNKDLSYDGNHTISYYATDFAGNIESTKTSYVLYNSTTINTVNIINPSDGNYRSNTVTFDVNKVVEDTNITRTTITIDGNRSTSFNPDNNCTSFSGHYRCSYNEMAFSTDDTNYVLIVRAYTKDLNLESTDTATFTFKFNADYGNVNEYYLTDVNGIDLWPSAMIDYNVTPVGQTDTNGIFQWYNSSGYNLKLQVDLNALLLNNSVAKIDIDSNRYRSFDLNNSSRATIIPVFATGTTQKLWMWFDLNLIDANTAEIGIDYQWYITKIV
jgi:hypothetical protein